MKNLFLIPAILLLLVGCASTIQPVQIPLPIKIPKFTIPPEPTLAIYSLKPGSPPDEVAKASITSIKQLIVDDKGLRLMLQSMQPS